MYTLLSCTPCTSVPCRQAVDRVSLTSKEPCSPGIRPRSSPSIFAPTTRKQPLVFLTCSYFAHLCFIHSLLCICPFETLQHEVHSLRLWRQPCYGLSDRLEFWYVLASAMILCHVYTKAAIVTAMEKLMTDESPSKREKTRRTFRLALWWLLRLCSTGLWSSISVQHGLNLY